MKKTKEGKKENTKRKHTIKNRRENKQKTRTNNKNTPPAEMIKKKKPR